MNVRIRGILENILDGDVTKKNLEGTNRFLKIILKDLKSRYSPLIAIGLGLLFRYYLDEFRKTEGRDPTAKDTDEFANWFEANAIRKIEEKADLYGI